MSKFTCRVCKDNVQCEICKKKKKTFQNLYVKSFRTQLTAERKKTHSVLNETHAVNLKCFFRLVFVSYLKFYAITKLGCRNPFIFSNHLILGKAAVDLEAILGIPEGGRWEYTLDGILVYFEASGTHCFTSKGNIPLYPVYSTLGNVSARLEESGKPRIVAHGYRIEGLQFHTADQAEDRLRFRALSFIFIRLNFKPRHRKYFSLVFPLSYKCPVCS